MAKDFFVILTETGRAKLANAVALGHTVSLTHCAVGDGAGQQVTPDAAQDALVRETYRAQLNTLETDPDNPAYIVAELVIPSEQGGWTIREAGVFDADGDLFAVGNLPETYKPQIAEGSAAELRVRLVLEVSNTAAVELKVDPTVVLASRSYVNEQIVEVRSLLETHTTRTDDPHHTIPEGGEPGQVLMRGADGAVNWGEAALPIPVGTISEWGANTPPEGWLELNGASFDMELYAELGKVFSEGALPDHRGLFARAVDEGRGVDRNRNVNEVQSDSIRNIVGEFNGHGFIGRDGVYLTGAFAQDGKSSRSAADEWGRSVRGVTFDASKCVPTSHENRPKNISVKKIVFAGEQLPLLPPETIYHYDEATGEYVGSSTYVRPEGIGLPAHATTVAPEETA